MVKAGETAGKLAESLLYLADHLEREYTLRSKTMGALLYPSLVLVLGVLIVFLMINTVVPSLRQVIEETGADIPAFTQVILDGAEIIRKYGVIFLAGFIGLVFLLLRYYKTESGKKLIDKLLLKVPLIGPFLKILSLSRLAESLSTLLSGGLMITQAIELSANVAGNSTYQEALFKIRDEVRRGVPVSSVLALYPDIFPPLFVQMTLVGEKTGNLAPSLMEVSKFYQGETERGITQLLNVLEPVLIIGLGGMVGGLIMSVLLPLYQTLSF
jgi:type IV pilus assembly protein PilC